MGVARRRPSADPKHRSGVPRGHAPGLGPGRSARAPGRRARGSASHPPDAGRGRGAVGGQAKARPRPRAGAVVAQPDWRGQSGGEGDPRGGVPPLPPRGGRGSWGLAPPGLVQGEAPGPAWPDGGSKGGVPLSPARAGRVGKGSPLPPAGAWVRGRSAPVDRRSRGFERGGTPLRPLQIFSRSVKVC